MPAPLMFGLAKFKIVDANYKPVPDVSVTVKTIDCQRHPIELNVSTGSDGIALFAVPQGHIPQLPTESEFELRTAKGGYQRGKVRCGGNEQINTQEVVLSVA